MSKGSTPRPLSIPRRQYDENWLRTFGRVNGVVDPKDPRYKDWRSAYEADKKRGKHNQGK
jgi:hypothetical protein